MARIRSLKPEFQQLQAMGRVSRDARLLFLLVQPQCDDHGKFRGASRMLASLLFPYDDDVPPLIDGWLAELERERCITRYVVDDDEYLQVENWKEYQKVDKPSASRFPDPPETSRAFASPRECSALDQGSRIKEGIEDGRGRAHARARGSARDEPTTQPLPEGWSPSVEDQEWTKEHRPDLGPSILANQLERFRQHAKGQGGRAADWHAEWRKWLVNTKSTRAACASPPVSDPLPGPDGRWRVFFSPDRKPGDPWDEANGPSPESSLDNPNIPDVARREWRRRRGLPGDWRASAAARMPA